jgi:dATP pyrophosphohydrolase
MSAIIAAGASRLVVPACSGYLDGRRRINGVQERHMARAPLQVLVLPFRYAADGNIEYAILRRRDHVDACWQGVAGGVEQGESVEEAARREMWEEAGIPRGALLLRLDTMASVPASQFHERDLWGPDLYVVTEHTFGVRVGDGQAITLSDEHTEVRWEPYEEAAKLLMWDSNRTALWELNERLSGVERS